MTWKFDLGALEDLADRAIEPYKVNWALEHGRRWPREGRTDAGLRVLTIWCRTRDGQGLMVAVRMDGGLDQFIVRVRELSPEQDAELTRFEERA